jgi:hypothetical protein
MRQDVQTEPMTLASIDRLMRHATILEKNIESYSRKATLKNASE